MNNRFKSSLRNGFSITAEIPPPKGISAKKSIEVARKVADKVDGVNVTDNQRGVMRMSALVFSHLLTDVGCEPILQICCRDRNRLSLQSDLLGASALGIKTICAMTGDYPTLGDNPSAKPVYDLDSILLIKMIKEISDGNDINGKPIKNHPSFTVGGVINPFYEPIDLELLKLKKKINAGATFFQTQPFFDESSLDDFLEKTKGLDSKILIGITPLKSLKMIEFLNDNVLTQPIPMEITKRLSSAKDEALEGIKISAEFINSIRNKVDGVHIMPINQVSSLPLLLEMIENG